MSFCITVNPAKQLANITNDLSTFQMSLDEHPEYAKEISKKIQTLEKQFQSLNLELTPKHSFLHISYEQVQTKFDAIREQLKNTPNSYSPSCTCVIL